MARKQQAPDKNHTISSRLSILHLCIQIIWHHVSSPLKDWDTAASSVTSKSVANSLRFPSRSGLRQPAPAAGGLHRRSDYWEPWIFHLETLGCCSKSSSQRGEADKEGELDEMGHMSLCWGYQGSILTLRRHNYPTRVSLTVAVVFWATVRCTGISWKSTNQNK